MANTFNSGGGEQNIGIGTGATGKKVNTYATNQQVPVEDLLKLLAEIKARQQEAADMSEFDQFGAAYDGTFNRNDCYDRPTFR